MEDEGPLLETLTRRLAECPPDFLAEPRIGSTGSVHVAAVVADLIRALGGPPLTDEAAAVFLPADRPQHRLAGIFRSPGPAPDPSQQRNRLRMVLIAAWLLYDPWFRSQRFASRAYEFLAGGLDELSSLVQAPRLVSDPDRREELARLCLKALGLRPAGETVAQAQDRLTTLSSVERQRVIREAQAAEERARQIRDAMARKAAQEAAARYSRE